jgi:uncharacterized protein
VSVVYLDSSAIVKLVFVEPETAGLRRWLATRGERTSCALARTEVVRAVRDLGPRAEATAQAALRDMNLIALDDNILDQAAILDPRILRSLDAIHIAAALSIGNDLDEVVSYDRRMLEGARLLGLPIASPV